MILILQLVTQNFTKYKIYKLVSNNCLFTKMFEGVYLLDIWSGICDRPAG